MEITEAMHDGGQETGSPVDWKPVLAAAMGDVRRLDHVWRFSSIPISVRETVSTHSFWVSTYACMIHRAAIPDDTSLLGAVAVSALTHDVAECVTGDVVRVFKYATPELKREVDRAEEILMRGLDRPIHGLFEAAEEMAGDAGAYVRAVVKAADFLDLVHFMRREALRGNGEMRPYYERMLSDLRAAADGCRGASHLGSFRPAELYAAMHRDALALYQGSLDAWRPR